MMPTVPLLPWQAGAGPARQTDWHILIFAAQALLVLVGYYLAVRFGALAPARIARMGLLVAGILLLLAKPSPPGGIKYPTAGWGWIWLIAFATMVLVVMPFGATPSTSLSRFMTLIPSLVYLCLFAQYMQGAYGPTEAKARLLLVFGWVYLFPVVNFFLSGNNPFAKLNIYGDASLSFVSNQYGWASMVLAVCLMDLRPRLAGRGQGWYGLWWLSLGMAAWLVAISGSRSGVLGLSITLALQIFLSGTLPRRVRVGLLAGALAAGIVLAGSEQSAINSRYRKTQTQLQTTEHRLRALEDGLEAFDRRPTLYLTGVGFDMYAEGVWFIVHRFPGKLHNSYVELLFTCGLFVFLWFVLGLVGWALWRFTTMDLGQYTFLPAFCLVPYSESNLGSGQFMFLPWMGMLMLYAFEARRK